MSSTIQTISFVDLAFAFVPVLLAIGILLKWQLNVKHSLYGVVRMLVQLLLIGYLLAYIFESHSAWIVVLVLAVMVVASSWIALGTVPGKRILLYKYAFISILLGGGITLAIVTRGVLGLDPWFSPQFMIPLAGMIFANSMNSVSLSAERLYSEIHRGESYDNGRKIALQASLIPVTNALFAVGLVSLPGMMTGQILSGVSPFIAVRYQIMVMCMLFGSSVISTACFLYLIEKPIKQMAKPLPIKNNKKDIIS